MAGEKPDRATDIMKEEGFLKTRVRIEYQTQRKRGKEDMEKYEAQEKREMMVGRETWICGLHSKIRAEDTGGWSMCNGTPKGKGGEGGKEKKRQEKEKFPHAAAFIKSRRQRSNLDGEQI